MTRLAPIMFALSLLASTANASPVVQFEVIGSPTTFSLDYGTGTETWSVWFGDSFGPRTLLSTFDPLLVQFGELPNVLGAVLETGAGIPGISEYSVGLDLIGGYLVLGVRMVYAPNIPVQSWQLVQISGVRAVPEPDSTDLIAIVIGIIVLVVVIPTIRDYSR